MIFESLDELLLQLDTDMGYIGQEIGKDVGEILHEESNRIYKVYSGGQARLRRMGEGGFGDKRNIKIGEVKKLSRGHSISIRNITKARGKASGAELDRFIEYGIYDIQGVPARPVYEWTKKRVVKEKTVETAINRALENKGWK